MTESSGINTPFGWRDALARERGPVRVATSLGATVLAVVFGMLFVDTTPLLPLAMLSPLAGIILIWLSVAAAREAGDPHDALARWAISVVHPGFVLACGCAAAVAEKVPESVPGAAWTAGTGIVIFALASAHAARARETGAAPALRRITVLGLVLAASGPILRGISGWTDELTLRASWFGVDLRVADAALGLLAATTLVCAAHVAGRFPRGPWPWALILALAWGWTLGWVHNSAFGLLVPAVMLVAPVLLTPVFAPRPRAGEHPERGPVGAAAVCLALACAGAIAMPGSLPPTEASPELFEHNLRWAMVAGTALLVRDLAVWVLLTRAFPHERWTGALWLVWLAASWTVLGGVVHAAGVPAALAMFAGPPWPAMIDGALDTNDLPRAAGAASAGAAIVLFAIALRARRGN